MIANRHVNRRDMIRSLVCGSVLLPGIVEQAVTAGDRSIPGQAKRIIFIYLPGGVSHVDSFDPKPRLTADEGKPVSDRHPGAARYLASRWNFQRGGKCGTRVSDLFPNIRECMDDICLIRSMHGDHDDHFQAALALHSGSIEPSLGSWVAHRLGTANPNLPAFAVLAPELPYAGNRIWSSEFLPRCHSGARVSVDDGTLPEAMDFSNETNATLALYGLPRGSTEGFAWQCLMARRLAERGVRFIELIDVGSHNNWDAHLDMGTHESLARNVDRPIAGLIKDLKSRGLLDDTLVVWTTEFGRSPATVVANGRDHHAAAFSSWLAGGGIKGGTVHGKTDEYGRSIIEDPVHIRDFQATLLHQLGLDHSQYSATRPGRVVRALLA